MQMEYGIGPALGVVVTVQDSPPSRPLRIAKNPLLPPNSSPNQATREIAFQVSSPLLTNLTH